MKQSIFVVLALLIVGCSNAPKPMYKWGNYQDAQIAYSKNTDDKKSLQKYEKELKKIISYDNVGPTIYSEYAFVLVKLGKKDEAKAYFEKEMQKFPESTVFIKNVIKKIYGENQ